MGVFGIYSVNEAKDILPVTSRTTRSQIGTVPVSNVLTLSSETNVEDYQPACGDRSGNRITRSGNAPNRSCHLPSIGSEGGPALSRGRASYRSVQMAAIQIKGHSLAVCSFLTANDWAIPLQCVKYPEKVTILSLLNYFP